MVSISICVGSSCHLKGAYKVCDIFKNLIDKYGLAAEIDLNGCFCQGKCTEGVVIRINEDVITGVSPDKVFDIFSQYLLGSTVK